MSSYNSMPQLPNLDHNYYIWISHVVLPAVQSARLGEQLGPRAGSWLSCAELSRRPGAQLGLELLPSSSSCYFEFQIR